MDNNVMILEVEDFILEENEIEKDIGEEPSENKENTLEKGDNQ